MKRLAGDEVAVLPDAAPAQGLAAKVAFLRRPESYPETTSRVEEIEAHMSWLFLTDRHVYKLKKPFCRNDMDYSTPRLRQLNCQREVRLNRPLAPEVYLGVVALTADGRGCLALGGRGRRVDSLVRMQRMPAALTLERRLHDGRIDAGDARRVAARLVPFFADAARARMSPQRYRRQLLEANLVAADKLRRPQSGLDRAWVEALAAGLRQFVTAHGELLDARARAGRIVEGHGDLRPEHIYLTQPPTVLDRIEFDRGLRLRDPVDELAFLAMECDRAGCSDFDGWLFATYSQLSGDDPPRALIEFHKAHNAFVRARIAIWHLDDSDTGPSQPWIDRANDYLAHASRYLARIEPASAGT